MMDWEEFKEFNKEMDKAFFGPEYTTFDPEWKLFKALVNKSTELGAIKFGNFIEGSRYSPPNFSLNSKLEVRTLRIYARTIHFIGWRETDKVGRIERWIKKNLTGGFDKKNDGYQMVRADHLTDFIKEL